MFTSKRPFRWWYLGFVVVLPFFLCGNKGCDGGQTQCPPNLSHDLAAVDWCYYYTGSEISFYGIVKNVGTQKLCGDGKYSIGLTEGTIITEKKYQLVESKFDPDCNSAPYWVVEPGKTYTLPEPYKAPFHPQNQYAHFGFVVTLAKDECIHNNSFQTKWVMTGDQILKTGKACK